MMPREMMIDRPVYEVDYARSPQSLDVFVRTLPPMKQELGIESLTVCT